MKRTVCVLMACTAYFGIIGIATAAPSESRVAMIVSNSDYVTLGDRLPGAARDAKVMREALEKVGFEVSVVQNANMAEMKKAVAKFADALKQAGPLAIGFFYYAGHGGSDQAQKGNYLMPVDVPNVTRADFTAVGLGVHTILERLAALDERPAISIVIDACRSVATATAGPRITMLEPDEPERGILVALSTGKGQPASDSGSYAKELSKALQQEGLTVDQVFEQVRREVNRINRNQVPIHKSKIVKTVCLVKCSGSAPEGKYSKNPLLLSNLRSDAKRVMDELDSLRAADRCSTGMKSLLELKGSAEAALKAGDVDTAGTTLEAMVQRGHSIVSELSALDSIKKGNDMLNAQLNASEVGYAKSAYEMHLTRGFDDTMRSATRLAKTDQLRRELDQAVQWKIDAEALAAEGRYYDATDKLVDAINLMKKVEEEGGNYRYPLPKLQRVRRLSENPGYAAIPKTFGTNEPIRAISICQ